MTCIYTQVDSKKASIATLEAQLDDVKKRSSNQLEEINRLEELLRNSNIEQTSMQSKIDNLQLNVSVCIRMVLYFKYKISF